MKTTLKGREYRSFDYPNKEARRHPGDQKTILRRSAIDPAIGHMKNDERLRRKGREGSLGDALHAVLGGAGHNLRMILRVPALFRSAFDPANGFFLD